MNTVKQSLFSSALVVLFVVSVPGITSAAQADLEAQFLHPSESARPRTWWHWVSGNVSGEGITKDLEAMKAIGLGGAQLFTVDQSAVKGPVKFMSPEWRQFVRQALSEADRLGLEMSIEGCEGWSESGGPWIKPEQGMQKVVWTETNVTGGVKVSLALPRPPATRGYYRDIALLAFPIVKGKFRLDQLEARAGLKAKQDIPFINTTMAPEEVIDPATIVNLSGKTEWEAPSGCWTVVRLGHTGTGATTHPSASAGLECDKMSRDAVRFHLEQMYGPIFADSPAQAGKALRYILLDSWEAGCANWTLLMPQEFAKRRGYDLTPWLPVFTGRVVKNADVSQRFLWDFRRTIADLVTDYHYGTAQQFAHEHKMGLYAEASGIGLPTVADNLACKGRTDIPMGEFWVNRSAKDNVDDPKEAASAAHLYGQNIAAAEAFTATANVASWANDPYGLKALGDMEFCLGINRFVFHRYAHQPWSDRQPGMSMGPWGINFERLNTWWKPGAAWIDYISRCQGMLQRGRFVADLIYFYGEGAPVTVSHKNLKPPVPGGYDYDVCNAEILLDHMSVENGGIVLKSGMRYRVLVLPDSDRMTFPVLQKIQSLVYAGATVYGPRPAKAPGLSGPVGCDQAVQKIAAEVWGDCDGVKTTVHTYGKGRILWGGSLAAALPSAPDFFASQPGVMYIHRRDGDAEIYFVSNQQKSERTVECTFRVSGKVPELWYPDTGRTERAPLYREGGGLTTIPLHVDPVGSLFVIFRNPPLPDHAVELTGDIAQPVQSPAGLRVTPEGGLELLTSRAGQFQVKTAEGKLLRATVASVLPAITLDGPWHLTFPAKLGAPASANFDRLISWTESSDDGIKYFSGTAVYRKVFDLPVVISDQLSVIGKRQSNNEEPITNNHLRLWLDLGTVKNLAEVCVNGKPLGVLWKEPFRVEITGAVKPGQNEVEIHVTNLWPNRLIGDQKLPQNQRITWASVSPYKADAPLLPSGLLGPSRIVPVLAVPVKGP